MKEQIKEIAKTLCHHYNTRHCEVCDHHGRCMVRLDAECIYNAGYRKQSEGEWIKHPASYECTACKEEFFVEGYAEDYDPITDCDLHFCPNCGAKMKGGE